MGAPRQCLGAPDLLEQGDNGLGSPTPRVLLNIKTIVNFSKALQSGRRFEVWVIG